MVAMTWVKGPTKPFDDQGVWGGWVHTVENVISFRVSALFRKGYETFYMKILKNLKQIFLTHITIMTRSKSYIVGKFLNSFYERN